MSFSFDLLLNPPAPTYPEYPALLAEARRTVPRFGDPANINPSREVVDRRGEDWKIAVLGRLNGSATSGRLSMVEEQLLILADQANIDPPLPEWIVKSREESKRHWAKLEQMRQAQRDREAAAWAAALAQCTVDLEVHSGSRPRTGGYRSEYLGHAVPTTDVFSGSRKVRRHPAGRALCESETRAKPLALSGKTDGPATCVSCLAWTPKVRTAADPNAKPPATTEDRGRQGEELAPVTAAAWEQRVRPVGWYEGYATLDVEDMGDGHVKVLWRCDAGDNPPEPFTIFRSDEKVWVKHW